MQFILKGITNDQFIGKFSKPVVDQINFDLRPRSFNFTQAYNIKNIIEKNPYQQMYGLMFENDKDFVVTELFKDIQSSLKNHDELILEFTGDTFLKDLENLNLPYIWHYQAEEKISNIANCKHLKRIVFKHSYLATLYENGELWGFFNLFEQVATNIFFEVQLEWDTDIILSMFEFFTLPIISLEINSMVEKSYQHPDFDLIAKFIHNISELFLDKDDNNENSHNQ